MIAYKHAPESKRKTGLLCRLFRDGFLMWLVDAIFEYADLGAEYFTPDPAEMLNAAFSGFSVVTLSRVIRLVIPLGKDPIGGIRNMLFKNKQAQGRHFLRKMPPLAF